MAELYWIDIGLLRHEASKEEFKWGSSKRFIHLELLHVVSIVKLFNILNKNNRSELEQGELRDISSPLYLPLLVNYLAVIDVEKIQDLLNQLFEEIPPHEQKKTFKYISEYYVAALSQFSNSVFNLKIKENRIKEWIGNNAALYIDPSFNAVSKKFFTLDSKCIMTITELLITDNIIQEDQKDIIIQHLNNNFSNTLKVNVKKNRFIKFLLRLTQNNLSKAGDKQELVNSLHKKILFKKGNNYLPMNYEYFYKLLVDESKAPKLELFSFLKI
jgi:hypothetical protein